MEEKDLRGMVLRVERSSVHDGSGFRTVVFLKGCPLRCQWCSTPESQSGKIETAQGKTYGTEMTVEEVLREIRKDSMFYFISGGGMTLSGGELLAQPEFSRALLRACRKEAVDTAIETSFFAPWESVSALLPYVNTAFVDLKLMDPEAHRQYCGADNQRILENLRNTNDAPGKFRLVVRTPLIPGVNDGPPELEALGNFCKGLHRLSYLQLLPYHRLGTATYEKLGRPYRLRDTPTPSQEQMEACRERVRACGIPVR